MCARPVPSTILTATINSTQTSLNVASTDDFLSSDIAILGAEIISYGAKNGTQFTDCIRGYDSTVKAVHPSGSIVTGAKSAYTSQSTETLNQLTNVSVISSSPLDLDETYGTVLVDATAAPVIVNLPAAAVATKVKYTIMKIDSSANSVAIIGYDTETINGLNTAMLNTQYDKYSILCDGASWYIFG
jgi:hypothetical protein